MQRELHPYVGIFGEGPSKMERILKQEREYICCTNNMSARLHLSIRVSQTSDRPVNVIFLSTAASKTVRNNPQKLMWRGTVWSVLQDLQDVGADGISRSSLPTSTLTSLDPPSLYIL